MKFNPVRRLTKFEKEFCELFKLSDSKAFAYRTAMERHDPNRMKEIENNKARTSVMVQNYATKLLEREHIKAYMEFLDLPPGDIADVVMSEGLLSPNVKEQVSTAKVIQQREEKENTRDAFERWKALMLETGHEIVLPVNRGAKEVSISFKDLVEGRAYVRSPLGARVELLHRAGAPWNDQDPDARLSELQIELLGRRERELIVHGGSGVGKSVLGGCFSLAELALPYREIAIISGTYDHCANEFMYVYAGFLRAFGRAAATRIVFANSTAHHDMEIQTIWGSRVRCFSTDREQGAAVLGKEFDLAVLGEGSHVSVDIFDRKIKRALDRRIKVLNQDTGYHRETGRSVIFTTPKGYDGCSAKEWERVNSETKGKWERAQVGGERPWLETIYLREASCIENPSYSEEAFEARRRTLPDDVFAEQYLGKMTRRSGLIYKEYSYRRHVRPELPEPREIAAMRLGVSMDTGKYFAGGMVGIDQDRKKHVLCEVYTQEQSIRENCEDLRDKIMEVLGPVFERQEWQDVSEFIDIWRVDPSSQHKDDIIEHLDVPLAADKLELLSSIDHVRTQIKTDQMLFYQEHLMDPMEGGGLLWEIERYQWGEKMTRQRNQTKTSLEPVKKDDHALDWLRWATHALDQEGPPEVEEVHDTSYEGMIQAMHRAQRDGLLKSMKGENLRGDSPGEVYRELHGI